MLVCITLVIILLVAVVGYVYWLIINVNPPPGPPPPEGYNSDYATMGTLYSAPLFEPDVLRRCADGSYMYTDNPALGAFCDTVPKYVLDRVACNRAYTGRPLRMRYTVPANACGTANACAPRAPANACGTCAQLS